MLRRIITLITLALGLALAISACESEPDVADGSDEPSETDEPGETEEPDGDPIEFLAVIPQTGDQAIFGELQEPAISMAVEDVNEAGGVMGRPLEVTFEDAGDEGSSAVAATQRGLGRDPVAVLGHQFSFMVFPLVDVVENAEIPFIHGAQTPELDADNEGNEWFFRVRSDDRLMGRSLLNLAVEELEVEAPAIHTGTDPVSTGFQEQITRLLDEEGIEPVATETHDLGDSDMTPQIQSITEADPDSVFVQTFVSESAIIARQHEELGLEVPVMWGPAVLFAAFEFDLIDPELVEGDYVSVDSVPAFSDDPDEQEFAERFEERSGLVANEIASSWYGAVLYLAHGIEEAGTTDPEPLADALAATQGLDEFKGVPVPGFTFDCDEQHNCYNKRELIQIRDGEPEPVLTFEP